MNGLGGVILFDCRIVDYVVVGIGALINEALKGYIRVQINRAISLIYPPLIEANIVVDFVPVKLR